MKNLLMISLLFVGFISCTSENIEVNENKSTHVVEETETLILDNGKKWIVNSETHEGMTQIKVILDNMDPLTLDDYSSMVNSFNEQTSFIISNCSMTGEPHNQLHHVLHPILDAINDLENATTMQGCDEATTAIEANITDYFDHFELKPID